MSKLVKALYVGNMEIAGLELPCAVLEDERRVITENGIATILGSRSGASKRIKYSERDKGRAPLPIFLAPKRLKPYIDKHLSDGPLELIRYGHKSQTVNSYDCRLLPRICRVWIEAALNGDLMAQQIPKTQNALSFLSGLGEVGIIGLVDEATGYQRIREERALATILEKFIAKELQPWTRTFPYEFYEQIFRLKRWSGPDGVKRPSVIGHYTNDIVYARLAHGVLEDLQRKNPTLPTGGRKSRHHQWFTPDPGHAKLKEHLAAVIALMKVAPNWNRFMADLPRAFPKLNEQIPLPLDD